MKNASATAAAAWASAGAATRALAATASPSDAAALRALASAAAAVQEALGTVGNNEVSVRLHAAFAGALASLPPAGGAARDSTGSLVTTASRGSHSSSDTASQSSAPASKPTETTSGHRVVATFPFAAAGANELDLRQGDVVEVLAQHASGWWTGRTKAGIAGYFPSNYTRPLSEAESARLERRRNPRRVRRAAREDGRMTPVSTPAKNRAAVSTPELPLPAREAPPVATPATTPTPPVADSPARAPGARHARKFAPAFALPSLRASPARARLGAECA